METMEGIDRYIINADELEPYEPGKHALTKNIRLVGKENVGAENMEVVLGVAQRSGGALQHTHSEIEQAIYVLEGVGRLEVGDMAREVGPGTMVFLPKGTPHALTVLSETPFKALVVYSPPLENKFE